jgi:hypothetical protein
LAELGLRQEAGKGNGVLKDISTLLHGLRNRSGILCVVPPTRDAAV